MTRTSSDKPLPRTPAAGAAFTRPTPRTARHAVPLLAAAAVLTLTTPTLAYVGPGAGIALFGSFLAVLSAVLSALLMLLTWPLRWIWRTLRGRRRYRRAHARRLIVLGLDGLEPSLVEQWMDDGTLPNLDRLRRTGCYRRLATTFPPLSPVAWSSFSTGVNPGKHNIFDFLVRNPRTCLPEISSVRIRPPRRTLRLGPWLVPLSRPEITGMRRSRTFWQVLGEHGIFSAVLRVPITFPPEKTHGVVLSAMCVPDLRGTQGTFSWYSTNATPPRQSADPTPESTSAEGTGGQHLPLLRRNGALESYLVGPANPLRRDHPELKAPFRLVLHSHRNGDAVLHIDGQRIPLRLGRYSPWVQVRFRAAPGVRLRGLCRFLLVRTNPDVLLYATPLHIDPDRPVMPISWPRVYATYLAKRIGPYATLGLAEDTWALNEGVIDEPAFLEQCYLIDDERQKQFFDALDRVRRGAVVVVFDAPDRIQHMFWRFIDERHPAADDHARKRHAHAIRDLYRRMDDLLGRTLRRLRHDDVLIVMSDHGFKPFRRGIDLNAWLRHNGYLAIRPDATGREPYLRSIDWAHTRAYAIGLAGIYLNLKGREHSGIVQPGEEERNLKRELIERLTGLIDPDTGETAILRVYDRADIYRGPYVENAHDLIVGYNVGYRVAWDAAVGKVGNDVFQDNTKAWSGDHCIDPSRVPGILLCNRPLADRPPRIIDIAPTALDLFGIQPPPYMDGRSLWPDGESDASAKPASPAGASA